MLTFFGTDRTYNVLVTAGEGYNNASKYVRIDEVEK